MMNNDEERHAPKEHVFTEELSSVVSPDEKLSLEDIGEVCFRVSLDLGQCEMTVRDVLELERGSVLHLDKQAGEMADVLVNELAIAKGEVVVLGDTLHVRIAEIRGVNEKELAGL